MGNISAPLLAELEHEAATTRKYLERIPDEKFAWTPHAKSMPLGRLATHVAEIPGWTNETMTLTLLDFDTGDYKPNVCANRAEILALFDKDVAKAKAVLAAAGDGDFFVNWSMKVGGKVLFTMPRIAVLRTWVFSHLVHHRAQLGVYLRLLDIPVPMTYGPSADEGTFGG